MKFGFLSGASTFGLNEDNRKKYRTRHDIRYRELIQEVVVAEEAGFDFAGWPEQHFINAVCATAPAPVLYGAAAAVTSRIRLRSAITVLPINHPIRVAEQSAAIDILSNGRFDLGTGRSNNAVNLRAFGASVQESMERYDEALAIIIKAFSGEAFSYEGKFWSLPDEVQLVPQPVQRPHPPLYVAASSVDSHFAAGKKGLGVMTFPNYQGFEALQRSVESYRQGIQESEPVGAYVNDSVGVLSMPSLCLEDGALAREKVYPYMRMFTKALRVDEYAYRNEIESLANSTDEMKFMTEESAGCVIGDPDDCIRQIEKYREIGITEVTLGIDGVPHDTVVESLRTFGKYVIPHFAGHA